MRKTYLLLLLLILFKMLSGQEVPSELRAAWVASVHNIDWPSSSSKGDVNKQKQELQRIIANASENNLNALFIQIRPNADALYKSSYEPWSEWLTGNRGDDPGYDPLQFAIEEAHKKGIEVHGWLNPYRYEQKAGSYSGKPGDLSTSNPELVMQVANSTYLNPGEPRVTAYLKKIVGDICDRYSIDGICFDDYFYPEAITSEDDAVFAQYGAGMTRGDFRRQSINSMIEAVHDTIKSIDASIRFGVSPFGIYSMDANAAIKHNTSLPSGIVGRDAYHAIYCDPLAWMEDSTVDYISPQLYWQQGGGQDFRTLCSWWAEECKKYNVQLYPSLAGYRLISSKWPISEIEDHITIMREYTNGLIIFSQKSLFNVAGFSSRLQEGVLKDPALWPEFGSSVTPDLPYYTGVGRVSGDPVSSVFWSSDPSYRYLVTSDNGLNNIQYQPKIRLPLDTTTTSIQVLSINRNGKKNDTITPILIPSVGEVELVLTDQIKLASSDSLLWNYASNASCYVLEIEEQDTEKIAFRSGLIQDTSFLVERMNLKGKENYVWRIRACNGNGCRTSEARFFSTGFPKSTGIVYPKDSMSHVPIVPKIEWEAISDATDYEIQISEVKDFSSFYFNGPSDDIEKHLENSPLKKWTNYYIRIRGENQYGKGQWSPIHSFRTTTDIPESPVFSSPEYGKTSTSSEVMFSWNKVESASGYHIEVSTDSLFENKIVSANISKYKRSFTTTMEEKGWYYARLCSQYVGGCGNWSNTLLFGYGVVTSSDVPNSANGIRVYPNPVKGELYILSLKPRNGLDIAIYDLSGRSVFIKRNLTMGSDKLSIDLSSLLQGQYVLIISDKNKRQIRSHNFVKL